MSKVYAVAVGRKTGLFTDWDEVKEYINGYKGAKYKGFNSHEDAEKYLDAGGVVEVIKPKLNGIVDLSKTCVIYADATRVPSKDSFRVCGVISTARGIVYTRAWSWQSDYELGSDIDLQCYAYTNAVARAYKEGYRSFCILYKNDCIRGWAGDWKARSQSANFYKSVMALMKTRYNCQFTFDKYSGSDSLHQKLAYEVKSMLQLDDVSEDYAKFGFKNEM